MEMQLDVIKDLRENNIFLIRSNGGKDNLSIGLAKVNIAYAIIIHSVIVARAKGESWQITLDQFVDLTGIDRVTLKRYLMYLVSLGILDAVDNTTFIPKMGTNPEQPMFIPVYTRAAVINSDEIWNARTRVMFSPRDTSPFPKFPETITKSAPDAFAGGYTLISYNYRGFIGEGEPLNILVAHSERNPFEGSLKAEWFAANGVKQVPNGFALLKSANKFWELATPEHFKEAGFCEPECAPVPFWLQMDILAFFGFTATESARTQIYRKLLLRTQDIVKEQPQFFPWITSVGVGNYDGLVKSSEAKNVRTRKMDVMKGMTPPPQKVYKITKPAPQESDVVSKEEPPVAAMSIRGRAGVSAFSSSQLIRQVFGSNIEANVQDLLVEQIIQARMFKYLTRNK